jgi:hypothetical protein
LSYSDEVLRASLQVLWRGIGTPSNIFILLTLLRSSGRVGKRLPSTGRKFDL